MNIRLLPEAERDLELGADFYESQRDGLGRYFNDCLSSDIESLQLYAGTHPCLFDLYRCTSNRFPFAIFMTLTAQTLTCTQSWIVGKTRMRLNRGWGNADNKSLS